MTGRIDVDVAIVGAGLVGSSAALALRKAGLSIALLDKGFCGAGASGTNYGGVRRQGRSPEQLPLAQRSHTIWTELTSLIGIDGEFRCSGHLKLARTEQDMAALESYATYVAGFGLDLELLSGNALAERFEWIGEAIVGASLCPGDGHANPRLVSAAFAAAARRAGVHVFEQTSVSAFTRNSQGFAIETLGGPTIQSTYLVNSAGAWADQFAGIAGEPVPLERIYPSMIVTEPVEPLMNVNIGMEGRGIYARQVERGNCIVGGVRGEALDNPDFSRPTSDAMLAMMRKIPHYFPALGHAHVIRFWSGTEAAMPDGNPVLGPSATMPGLVHAFGFTGAGFQLAPGVGEVIADLICNGRTETPINAFSINRFSPARSANLCDRTFIGSNAAPSEEPIHRGAHP